jgi:serine O-acetyltransferase
MPGPCPCSGGLIRAFRRDFDRYLYSLNGDAPVTVGAVLRVIVMFPGLWAVIPYRLCHHFLYQFRPRFLGQLLAVPAFAAQRMAMLLFGIEIDSRAHIGGGFFVNHFGGIIIGPATIGANCNISQGVTVGRSSQVAGSAAGDVPILGDRVWLGPGAVVAGPITLGDDATVAGNSLVTRDVPARGVAMGVPAQTVSRKGSFRQVSYRGMADDPHRSAGLTAAVMARDAQGPESS